MATTMIPPTPPASPAPSPKPQNQDSRYVAVRARLLPDEIVSARQTEVVRKQVLVALVIVVVLLVGWYVLSWWQTRSANDNLNAAQSQGQSLQQQQRAFTPLVHAITDTANINGQLDKLMVGDLQWNQLVGTVRKAAPAQVVIGTVNGQVTSGAAVGTPPPGGSVLNATGKASIGDVSITGIAPDKRAVAAYADQLGKVPGLTAPLVTSIQMTGKVFNFTVDVVITTDALTQVASTTGGN